MPKASKRIPQPAPAACPVVALTQKLLFIWDADNGSQREYLELEHVPEQTKEETLHQFGEWREAIEKIIAFTEPRNLEGALVQIALARDTLRDVDSFLKTGKHEEIGPRIFRIDGILGSVMRKMRSAIGSEIDPVVQSVLDIYASSESWVDNVNGWAERGQLERVGEGGE
jgi:hypothetical protein